MKRHYAMLVLATVIALGMTSAGTGGTEGVGVAAAEAAPKKCKKGTALFGTGKKARCVKRCPAGRTKKKGRNGVRCVKRPANKQPAPVRAPTPAPAPAPAPVPAPATPAPAQPAPPPDTNALWRSLVVGSSMQTFTYNATTGGSTKTVYNFCADGASFTYYYEFVGSVTNEAKNREGTYTLERTEAGVDGHGQFVDGLIAYQSNIEEQPSGQVVVRVYPGSSRAYIAGAGGATEYQRSAGAAGC